MIENIVQSKISFRQKLHRFEGDGPKEFQFTLAPFMNGHRGKLTLSSVHIELLDLDGTIFPTKTNVQLNA